MDASALEAIVYDPSKCSKLSMDQKRELVYEISKWSDSAAEMLQAWSRQEILQVLCAELGKERKYTGLTKSKIIEQLLKIVYEKKSQETNVSEENDERTPKRQRKSDHPNRLAAVTNENAAATVASDVDSVNNNNNNTVYCKNSACKATMNRQDAFCKRCSCCICRQYDDNKDPSLWLTCNSDPPFHGVSCGMSCHFQCALRHENSGISRDRQDKGLDGSFCCVSCGKVNDLLGSWRKQLVVARDTRRVDILCYRLSLGQKILAGTKHYQNLYGIIDEAVKKLEEDVGPLTGLPVKMARGIVNRLSSGPEIQRLCASAVESLDLMLSSRVSDSDSDGDMLASKLVTFEDIRATSLTVVLNSDESNMQNIVGYSLWHRKADDVDYSAEPTCKLFTPNTKFLLSDLTPGIQYFLKVVTFDTHREMGFSEFQFQTGHCSKDEQIPVLNSNKSQREVERSQSPATNCSTLSNPSSVEDETNNLMACREEDGGDIYKPATTNETMNCSDQSRKETNGDVISLLDEETSNKRNKESSNGHETVEASMDNGSNRPAPTGLECVPCVDRMKADLPITPCRFENVKEDNGNARSNRGKGKDIENGPKRAGEPNIGSSSKKRIEEKRDEDFEYYVKIVRWLECDGHIEAEFRQKFLTWYSLRASPEEVRVVKVFVDTFIEDPESLAAQLVDTFSDVISSKRCSTVPAGFCMKLWH